MCCACFCWYLQTTTAGMYFVCVGILVPMAIQTSLFWLYLLRAYMIQDIIRRWNVRHRHSAADLCGGNTWEIWSKAVELFRSSKVKIRNKLSCGLLTNESIYN